jgi:hypothetical protein
VYRWFDLTLTISVLALDTTVKMSSQARSNPRTELC